MKGTKIQELILLPQISLQIIKLLKPNMQSSYLIKPFKHIQPAQPLSPKPNIFSQTPQPQPTIELFTKQKTNHYNYIGSSQLRDKLISQHLLLQNQRQKQSKSALSNPTGLPVTINVTTTLQSNKKLTNQSKVTSSMSKKLINRDLKGLNHYKQYQQLWKKQNQRIKDQIYKHNQHQNHQNHHNNYHNQTMTLLESNIKKLQVIPNPQKEEVLIKYLNNYWEMSLRNNNKALTSFMKGDSRFDEVELAKRLNLDEEKKQLEKRLPRLSVQKLQRTNEKQFLVFGRNKLDSQCIGDPSLQSYRSRVSGASLLSLSNKSIKQQDIYKMNYDIAHGYSRPYRRREAE